MNQPLRLMGVMAHPDDETIGTGATMARYAASGAHVTLVTCTGGEMGEILVPELAHLAADQEDGLGEHRRGELADAMAALGFDSAMILADAIKRAGGTDKAKVRDAIEATKCFVATSGTFNMSPEDHMGLNLSAFRMLEVKNGNWTLMK